MSDAVAVGSGRRRVLVVDDEAHIRDALRDALRPYRREWETTTADSVDSALAALEATEVDAVVADLNMPGRSGFELLSLMRASERFADVPVIIVTGALEHELKRKALELGATDLLNKPVDLLDLIARLRSALRLKACQDELKSRNRNLEKAVRARTSELERARLDLIWRLGKAAEFRDAETGWHVVRVGYFARELALAVGVDHGVADMLFHTAPLHDVGKIGIPDQILLKPGRLTADEWEVMKTHTRLGAEILRPDMLETLASEGLSLFLPGGAGDDGAMLTMASEVALRHHERWDGGGYPDGLAGDAIPLAARIVTVADVFDALSSRRPYKAPIDEATVLDMIRRGAGTQFDPAVAAALETRMDVFREVQARFEDRREHAVGAHALSGAPHEIAPL
ncbi:MAG TPA: HD domain-containing phosphohydrolase [Planctomycetota bacterium]|nr:HD domain-containing phosphohydrolase [Planctomycetota bacterium]